MDRRPPLALSPRRLRPRRAIPPRYPCNPPVQKSPATNYKKSQAGRISVSGASFFRSESDSISSELLSITKKPKSSETLNFSEFESEKENQQNPFNPIARNYSDSNSTPLFERGRFYDLYSARRNERLKKRQMELMDESEVAIVSQNPAIAVELQKKKNLKRNESARNSISGEISVSRIPNLSSSLRNSKDVKKVGNLGFEEKKSNVAGTSMRRIGTRSAAKRY
ncbi:hypothetical protein LUZ60_002458 [Juncus effusus]|nr:hypothetical protein LUZ60_002458 [Juncus effusus]